MLTPIREGLADLDRRAREAGADDFADLPAADQDEVVRAIEGTPFFFPARLLVVLAVFADSSHGGNRGGVGWQIAGFVPEPTYQPPFGFYDAEAPGAGSAGE
jgi:hypothetical protein